MGKDPVLDPWEQPSKEFWCRSWISSMPLPRSRKWPAALACGEPGTSCTSRIEAESRREDLRNGTKAEGPDGSGPTEEPSAPPPLLAAPPLLRAPSCCEERRATPATVRRRAVTNTASLYSLSARQVNSSKRRPPGAGRGVPGGGPAGAGRGGAAEQARALDDVVADDHHCVEGHDVCRLARAEGPVEQPELRLEPSPFMIAA